MIDGGWHLGGIAAGDSRWAWEASPATTVYPLDGLGSFFLDFSSDKTSCGQFLLQPYAGGVVMAGGRNVIYSYHGEFFRGAGFASQWMHFFDDGLFVGQFGTPYDPTHEVTAYGARPGLAVSPVHPTLVRVDADNNEALGNTPADTYIWADDASAHSGTIRWHVLGADQILEKIGTVPYGSAGTLADASVPTWPTGLSVTPGDGQVQLHWTNVAGVSSYDVKTAAQSGGPYHIVAPSISGPSCTVALDNATASYFVVSAAGSTINSNEVVAYGFSGQVGIAGEFKGGPIYPWQVSSSGPLLNSPALAGISNILGNLSRTSIGSKGYAVYNWRYKTPASYPPVLASGNTINTDNFVSGFSASLSNNWIIPYQVSTNFVIDGQQGTTTSIAAPTGSSAAIAITVPQGDTSIHYLTIFSPSSGISQTQSSTFTLAPTGNPTGVSYSINEPSTQAQNHIFQFEFVGTVTLTVTNSGGFGDGEGQAIFLD